MRVWYWLTLGAPASTSVQALGHRLPFDANRRQRKQSRVKDLYVRIRTQYADHALVWFAYHSTEDFFAVTRQSQHALLGEPNISEPKKYPNMCLKGGFRWLSF